MASGDASVAHASVAFTTILQLHCCVCCCRRSLVCACHGCDQQVASLQVSWLHQHLPHANLDVWVFGLIPACKCLVVTVAVLVACRLQWGSTSDWHQPQKDSRQWPGPNESCSAVVVDTLHGDPPELWDGALQQVHRGLLHVVCCLIHHALLHMHREHVMGDPAGSRVGAVLTSPSTACAVFARLPCLLPLQRAPKGWPPSESSLCRADSGQSARTTVDLDLVKRLPVLLVLCYMSFAHDLNATKQTMRFLAGWQRAF